MSGVSGTFAAVKAYIESVVVELKKSSWPTRAELVESTAVIIFSVMALGLFVATSDVVIERLISFLAGASG
ncbi:MAG: preprotein translocase subunit SecE [bacterium]